MAKKKNGLEVKVVNGDIPKCEKCGRKYKWKYSCSHHLGPSIYMPIIMALVLIGFIFIE